MQLKPLNYVSNPVLAHRQKLLYNLPPQQQQFPPVEQPTYVVQEKPLVVHEPENLFNVDFEKASAIIINMIRKSSLIFNF